MQYSHHIKTIWPYTGASSLQNMKHYFTHSINLYVNELCVQNKNIHPNITFMYISITPHTPYPLLCVAKILGHTPWFPGNIYVYVISSNPAYSHNKFIDHILYNADYLEETL